MNGKKAHIMVVDDEASMRTLLKDFLESQGYKVHCHVSARGALASLQNGTKTDAIVSHVRMDPMSGIDLLQAVKQNSPSIPVLLFTGAGNPDERARSLELGASKYLFKPFSLTELKVSLEHLLAKRESKS